MRASAAKWPRFIRWTKGGTATPRIKPPLHRFLLHRSDLAASFSSYFFSQDSTLHPEHPFPYSSMSEQKKCSPGLSSSNVETKSDRLKLMMMMVLQGSRHGHGIDFGISQSQSTGAFSEQNSKPLFRPANHQHRFKLIIFTRHRCDRGGTHCCESSSFCK